MTLSKQYARFMADNPGFKEADNIPLQEVIRLIPCRINPGRALVKMGLKRKRVDRLFSRKQCLTVELFEVVWGLLQDLEAVTFQGDKEARLRVLAAVERLYPAEEPAEVAVEIVGPDWLDPELWIPESGRVKTRQARWLLQNLDGLAVGGEFLEIRCTPPIRKGRIPPKREPDAQRKRRLFHRWFEGIQVDEEGLFSLTPEFLAMEMTTGLTGRVVDATCGVGALAIAAARQPGVHSVHAIDCNRSRLDMARHNAEIYQQQETITFSVARAEEVLAETEADWLLLDPPWGGTDYDRDRVRLCDIPFPVEDVVQNFTGAIRMKLPRSFVVADLGDAWSVQPAVDDRGVLKFLVAERSPVPATEATH